MPTPLLIAANWKMHPAPSGVAYGNAETAPRQAPSPYHPRDNLDIVVFPTFLDLRACIAAGIVTGAQCGRPEEHGAHTGDVSMQMIKDVGCQFVLCGHSERRRDHGESDAFIAAQAKAALEIGLNPIVCIGETEQERDAGQAEAVVAHQLASILDQFSIVNSQLSILNCQFSIAYEPVWAIGTGKTATPEIAQAMHAFVRSQLPAQVRESTRILYGGSVNPENAGELLSQPDIDGALVGGASLDPEAFGRIIACASVVSES